MTRTTTCKRCRCEFSYESVLKGERMSWRSICDPCVPLQKAEHKAAHAKKRKETLQANKAGMGKSRDPYQDLTVRGYASVGRILGCSAEAVRVAEASALAHCRRLFTYRQLCVLMNHGQ